MKSILAFVCCLALVSAVYGEEQDQSGKQKKGQGKGQPQPQAQQQVVKPKGHPNKGQGQGQHQQLQTGKHQGKKGQNVNQAQGQTDNAGQGNVNQGKKGHHLNQAEGEANANAGQGNVDQGKKGQGGNQAEGQANMTKHQAKHFDLKNGPNPAIASVKFKQNNHIEGSQNWKGEKYRAFSGYNAQWHDQGWWHQHYKRVILISGGYYYWNSGFWYPAWGYDSAYSYYPYDGPIYAYNDLPPDQVIANVQASLQAQGYYQGEVDGLLGPQTRAALAGYQRDHGLYTTAAIDEPTLSSLGMG
jgi:hypothetical protein